MDYGLRLRVVVNELLFSTHPILNVVAILPATQFVQIVGELRNLVVGRSQPTASVSPHALACGLKSDETRCFGHNCPVLTPTPNDQTACYFADADFIVGHGLRLDSSPSRPLEMATLHSVAATR